MKGTTKQMPDVFISYSVKDERLSQFVRSHLLEHKLDVFLASISLNPGEKWTPQILSALKMSDWVFFIASKSALESAYVQQELGAALVMGKKIVPIMWDVSPSELPGWISQYQGLNLRGATIESVSQQVAALAAKVKADKQTGQIVAGAFLFGLLYLLSKS